MGRTSLHTDEKLLKTGAALARKKGLSGFYGARTVRQKQGQPGHVPLLF